MTIGTVKFFNSSKGFGFIAPEGGAKDVFVHATALEAAGMTSLSEGQKVSFDIQPDAKGSKAVNLQNAQKNPSTQQAAVDQRLRGRLFRFSLSGRRGEKDNLLMPPRIQRAPRPPPPSWKNWSLHWRPIPAACAAGRG